MRILNCVICVAVVGMTQIAAQQGNETAAVQAAVDGFHAALRTGDKAAAMRLIAEDAVFLEGGNIETRAEYEKNHLPADIDFEKVIQSKQKVYRVTVSGNTAWAILTSEMVGTFEKQPVNLAGATLMVLSRETAGWRIRSIHWSSHRR